MMKRQTAPVIRYDRAEGIAYIYSCPARAWRRLEANAQLPVKCSLKSGQDIAQWYGALLKILRTGFGSANESQRSRLEARPSSKRVARQRRRGRSKRSRT